jgi:nitrate/TMAO reductase-like tetraheme cytochrome c subunit
MPPKSQSKGYFFRAMSLLVGLYKRNKAVFISVCVAALILCCVATYLSVEMTSTVAFCTSCHELKPAFDSYRVSSHYNVKPGQRAATCRDCHLPPWSHPIRLLISKIYHGSKDVTRHFVKTLDFGEPGFYFSLKMSAKETVGNANCLKCHTDAMRKNYDEEDNIHTLLINNPGFKCYECHEDIVHKDYLPKSR